MVGDQHFTHFLLLQIAAYLSEAKEDGSQYPVHGTCSWTVADPNPPPPQHLEKRIELAVLTLDLNGIEDKVLDDRSVISLKEAVPPNRRNSEKWRMLLLN